MEIIKKVEGELNISPRTRLANINNSIRLGLPQVRGHATNDQRVVLVASGSSLLNPIVVQELRDLYWQGCPIVAMNGSYEWLISINIKPSSMVMIDGRAFNARFITEYIESCKYFIASQCAPEVFLQLMDKPNVYIWHCLTGDDPVEKELLDNFYMNMWQPVAGGCTVGTRAIVLMRILGFTKFEIFGMDSCYLDYKDHVLPQAENFNDKPEKVFCAGREFTCNAWQIAQALEFIDLIASNGQFFKLNLHGNGLLAHMLEVGGSTMQDFKEQVGK